MTLSTYLKRQKLSQRAFADLLGVAPAQVSQWLTGYRTPGLATAFSIQKATGGAVPAESWLRCER